MPTFASACLAIRTAQASSGMRTARHFSSTTISTAAPAPSTSRPDDRASSPRPAPPPWRGRRSGTRRGTSTSAGTPLRMIPPLMTPTLAVVSWSIRPRRSAAIALAAARIALIPFSGSIPAWAERPVTVTSIAKYDGPADHDRVERVVVHEEAALGRDAGEVQSLDAEQADLLLPADRELHRRAHAGDAQRLEHLGDPRLVVGAEDRVAARADDSACEHRLDPHPGLDRVAVAGEQDRLRPPRSPWPGTTRSGCRRRRAAAAPPSAVTSPSRYARKRASLPRLRVDPHHLHELPHHPLRHHTPPARIRTPGSLGSSPGKSNPMDGATACGPQGGGAAATRSGELTSKRPGRSPSGRRAAGRRGASTRCARSRPPPAASNGPRRSRRGPSRARRLPAT